MRRSIVLLGLMATAACSHAGSDDAFHWTDEVTPGSIVHVRDGVGSIRVSRAPGQTAVIRASRSWRHGKASDIRFAVEHNGNEYFVCAMWRNSGKCADGHYRGRNTGGFLSMFSLFHHSSDATADFVVELPADVALDVTTSSGAVDIDGASAGVRAHNVNGTIRATNVSGPLALSTTNGDVRVTANAFAPTDSIRLTTTNGSVHAELPANLDGNFDLSVVNGVVTTTLPIPPASASRAGRHLAGQIGTATRNVKMRSVNGAVVVTTRQAPASGQ